MVTKDVEPSPEAAKMHGAYDALMNDLDLLAKGLFGTERVPADPTYFLHRDPKVTQITMGNSPTMQAVRELRRELGKAGWLVGDGLITLDPHKKGIQQPNVGIVWGEPNPKASKPSTIRFWWGDTGAGDPAHRMRAWDRLIATATEARAAIRSHPTSVFEKKLGDATFTARAIRFGSPKCASCHAGTKVGDVAAISAVVLAKSQPGNDRAVSVPEPMPTNVESEIGFKFYPGSRETPHKPTLVRKGNQEIFTFEHKSTDSPDKIFKFFVEQFKAKSDGIARVFGAGTRFSSVDFEFGDRHFGRLVVAAGRGSNTISFHVNRLIE